MARRAGKPTGRGDRRRPWRSLVLSPSSSSATAPRSDTSPAARSTEPCTLAQMKPTRGDRRPGPTSQPPGEQGEPRAARTADTRSSGYARRRSGGEREHARSATEGDGRRLSPRRRRVYASRDEGSDDEADVEAEDEPDTPPRRRARRSRAVRAIAGRSSPARSSGRRGCRGGAGRVCATNRPPTSASQPSRRELSGTRIAATPRNAAQTTTSSDSCASAATTRRRPLHERGPDGQCGDGAASG